MLLLRSSIDAGAAVRGVLPLTQKSLHRIPWPVQRQPTVQGFGRNTLARPRRMGNQRRRRLRVFLVVLPSESTVEAGVMEIESSMVMSMRGIIQSI